MRSSRLAVLLFCALALTACGVAAPPPEDTGDGDDDGGDPGELLSTSFTSETTRDGYLLRDTESELHTTTSHPSGEIDVGDEGFAEGERRGYLSFDISSLAGKTIESASLELVAASHVGDPWSLEGGMRIDRWDMEQNGVPGLDSEDFDIGLRAPGALASVTGPVTDDQALPSIDVTEAVRRAVNGGGSPIRAEFRLIFPAVRTSTTTAYVRLKADLSDAPPTLRVGYRD